MRTASPQALGAAQRRALLADIGKVIAVAAETGTMVRTGDLANTLVADYPAAGFTVGRIIVEITAAAAASKVPVEIDRPGGE